MRPTYRLPRGVKLHLKAADIEVRQVVCEFLGPMPYPSNYATLEEYNKEPSRPKVSARSGPPLSSGR